MATTNPKNAPKIVSIFSGCGGLDYGFHTEGYETIWANDFAEWACKSFAVSYTHLNSKLPKVCAMSGTIYFNFMCSYLISIKSVDYQCFYSG